MKNQKLFLGAFYVVFTFTMIIFVTVALPNFLFQPTPTPGLKPYSKLEQKGRDIYAREGCFYCHSQFVRLQDREMGEVALPGDYAYDDKNLLGTARTGPDLARIGGRFPDSWHKAHHSHPSRMNPGSIMPSYDYLNYKKIKHTLPDGREVEVTEMDALVAYLQTLGRHMESKNKFILAPWELRFGNDKFKFHGKKITQNPIGDNPGAVGSGRGLFMQNCAVCHGTKGLGNGPAAVTMTKKPANFTRPFYKDFTDDFWFYRVKEGVPGTRMPRWGKTLSDEQMWYLVAYLKSLPQNQEIIEAPEDYRMVAPQVDEEGKYLPELK